MPKLFCISRALLHFSIISNGERATDISFMAGEDRADIEKENVVLFEDHVRFAGEPKVVQRALAEADLWWMPSSVRAHLCLDFSEEFTRFALAHAGFDLVRGLQQHCKRLVARRLQKVRVKVLADCFVAWALHGEDLPEVSYLTGMALSCIDRDISDYLQLLPGTFSAAAVRGSKRM